MNTLGTQFRLVLICMIFFIDNTQQQNCTEKVISVCKIQLNCSGLNLALQTNWNNVFNSEFIAVTDLILSNTNLSFQLPITQINNYPSLYLLDLSQNAISESTSSLIQIACKTNLFNTFILSFNRFKLIPFFSNPCMNYLKYLYLNNNQFVPDFDLLDVSYSGQIIQKFASLAYLDLSYSGIQYLNRLNNSIFQLMPNLVSLNLYSNKIRFIYANPFAFTPLLAYLNIDANPLQCDSNLIWFKYFLIQKPLLYVNNSMASINTINLVNSTNYYPLCFNNLTQTNYSIADMSDNLFYTSIQLTTNLTSQNAYSLAGSSVSFTCSVYSIPESNIWWSFNQRDLIRSADGPYVFYDTNNSQYNKTSTLYLQIVQTELQGTYECKTSYTNFGKNFMVKSLAFKLSVAPSLAASQLSSGEIVGIVFGCIIGLLLILILLLLTIYFICYKRRLCCFRNATGIYGASGGAGGSTSSKSYLNANKITRVDEIQSGFNDDYMYTKPNYILNTISKSSDSGIMSNDYKDQADGQGLANTAFNSTRYMTTSSSNVSSSTTPTEHINHYVVGNTAMNSGVVIDTNQESYFKANHGFVNEYSLGGQNGQFGDMYANEYAINDDADDMPSVQYQNWSASYNNSAGKNLINEQKHYFRTSTSPKQISSTIPQNVAATRSAIYFNSDADIINDNDEMYVQQQLQQQQQQQYNTQPFFNYQQQYNNSFFKYDSDV